LAYQIYQPIQLFMYRILFILGSFCCIISSYSYAQSTNESELNWLFETQEDSVGTPQTTIYLMIAGHKHLIGKGIGNFNALEKNAFGASQYQIPPNATLACAGYWAGLGHQLCVFQKEEMLDIKEGFLDEMAKKGTKIKYKTIKVIRVKQASHKIVEAIYESCAVYAGSTKYYFKTSDGETIELSALNPGMDDEPLYRIKIPNNLIDNAKNLEGPPGANPKLVGKKFNLIYNDKDEIIEVKPLK
jgi:hypothetical protein